MIRSSVPEGSRTEGVGARLKRLRLQRGLSQRDLSSPGVSYAYISRIEAGARTPSVKALRKLSQKLAVSVEYLETGRDIRDVDDRELRLADAELELRLAETTAEPEQKLEKILDESVAAGDIGSAQRARIGLGLAAAQRGSHLESVERLEAALAEEGHAPPPHMRPDLYTTLGQSYAALGAPDRAVALFGRCLEQRTLRGKTFLGIGQHGAFACQQKQADATMEMLVVDVLGLQSNSRQTAMAMDEISGG